MYDEFNNVVDNARNGDLESIADILHRLRPLILAQIKRYYNKRDIYEDLLSQGNLVVLDALNSFDDSRGVKFLGYVKCQLMYAFLDRHKEKTYVSLNSPISDEGSGEMIDRLVSEDSGPLELFLTLEKNTQLYMALNSISKRQKEVIILFYIERKSIPEIAKILGVSYRTVVNTKTNGLKKMKKILL